MVTDLSYMGGWPNTFQHMKHSVVKVGHMGAGVIMQYDISVCWVAFF
jgi:hypothetical protein